MKRDTTILYSELDKVVTALKSNAASTSRFSPGSVTPDSYNSYIDFAVGVYVAKHYELYRSIRGILRDRSYLVYAQVCRAIIENTAAIHSCSVDPKLKGFQAAWQAGASRPEELLEAFNVVDRFVRGTRFTWNAFIEGRYDALSRKPENGQIEQARIGKSLKKLWCDSPQLENAYDLLCDAVHPNLGSNLLVIRADNGGVAVGGTIGGEFAESLVPPILAATVSAYKPFQNAGLNLEKLRLRRGPPNTQMEPTRH